MSSISEVAVASLIMATGCAFQAAFGIGMALIVVPLLALINTAFVPGPILFAGVLLAAGTAYRDRDQLDRVALNWTLLGLGIGTVAGAVALNSISGIYISKVFGLLILLAIFLSVTTINIRATKATLVSGSIASGIMGIMVGIHGPAISLVLQNEKPARARAILGAYFTVGYIVAVVSLAYVGRFGHQEITYGLALLPGVALAYILAPRVSQFVDQRLLKAAIIIVSSTSAVFMLLR